MVMETPSGSIRITVSIGVAPVGSADKDWSVAIRKADHAMYMAKESGRNRIAIFADEHEQIGCGHQK